MKAGYDGLVCVKGVKSSLMFAHNDEGLSLCSLEYIGEVKQGLFHGYGVLKTPTDYLLSKHQFDYYIGTWKDGHQHG